MGKVEKGVRCTIKGCTQPAVRSISAERIADARMDSEPGRRGYLCKTHYRELKKRTRKDRMLERWRFST